MINPLDPNAEIMRVLVYLSDEELVLVPDLLSKVRIPEAEFLPVVQWLKEKGFVAELAGGFTITSEGQSFFNEEVERTA
jgi:hypothetical protein